MANKFLHGSKWFYVSEFRGFPRRTKADGGRAPVALKRTCHRPLLLMRGSVTSRTTPAFANLIRVDRSTAAAGQCSDCGTLLPTSHATNQGAGANSGRGGQLVAMFLPKTPAMLMAIANATVVRVPVVPMTMAEIATCLRGRWHDQQHYKS